MITNLSESPRLERLAQLADSNGPMIAWMGGITGVLIGLAFIAAVVMVIAAVVSALTNEDTSGGGKLLWVIFILWFPLFGAIAWFVVGKKGHLNRFLGIDRGRPATRSPPVSASTATSCPTRSGSAASEPADPSVGAKGLSTACGQALRHVGSPSCRHVAVSPSRQVTVSPCRLPVSSTGRARTHEVGWLSSNAV